MLSICKSASDLNDIGQTYSPVKGQLKRRDKLTSIVRFGSSENGFERSFEKFVFALEISDVKIEELCGTNCQF